MSEFEQEFACDAQAAVDVEGVIESWIVDQTFPTHGGAGFLKIDPHHDEEVFFQTLSFSLEFCGVFESGLGIVNRAGTDDDHESVILKRKDGIGLGASGVYDFCGLLVDRKIVCENSRGYQGVDAGDA